MIAVFVSVVALASIVHLIEWLRIGEVVDILIIFVLRVLVFIDDRVLRLAIFGHGTWKADPSTKRRDQVAGSILREVNEVVECQTAVSCGGRMAKRRLFLVPAPP